MTFEAHRAGMWIGLPLAAGLVAACVAMPAAEGGHEGHAEAKPAAQFIGATAAQREGALAGADWSRREDLLIEMHDYGYRPRELRLRAGQPYRLTLLNNGSVSHYFVAPEFFASVATRKAEVPHVAEFKAADFTSFEVHGRGGTLDYYFIPLVKGRYRAHCHIKDHLALNIEAFLVVE